jgi:hypothetical protein
MRKQDGIPAAGSRVGRHSASCTLNCGRHRGLKGRDIVVIAKFRRPISSTTPALGSGRGPSRGKFRPVPHGQKRIPDCIVTGLHCYRTALLKDSFADHLFAFLAKAAIHFSIVGTVDQVVRPCNYLMCRMCAQVDPGFRRESDGDVLPREPHSPFFTRPCVGMVRKALHAHLDTSGRRRSPACREGWRRL